MEISLRYTPVTGRLHTRYAPVRRSSPKYCYLALPLDLHVLSLPLAFILSQDQTLHCKNCLFLPFDSSSCPPHIFICGLTHAISIFSSCQISLAFFNRRFFGESGCKDTTIFKTTKIFFQKNLPAQHNFLVYQHYPSQKNFRPPSGTLPQKPSRARKISQN